MRGILFLGLASWRLLSRKFHRAVLWNVLFLIFQSGLEIFSAMVLLPLFYQLTAHYREPSGSALLNRLIDFSGLIPWSSLVLLIVLFFFLKNLTGLCFSIIRIGFENRVRLCLTQELYV